MEKMYIVKMREAQKQIELRNAFRASNLQGLKLEHNGFKSYIILSYATIIYGENNNGVFINRLEERFSRSTSIHQNIVKKALNIK